MDRVIALALLVCVASVTRAGQPPAPKPGEVVFAAAFDEADALGAWPSRLGKADLVAAPGGGKALRIDSADATAGAHVAVALPAERFRGCTLFLSARVRAENVSDRPNPWNGIKFMAPLVADGRRTWPQAAIGVGTFDWQPVAFNVRVPPDADGMSLVLGLELVTGQVWFDDVKVVVRRGPVVPRPRAAQGPVHKGHALPRLRGAMVSPNATADDLRVLGKEWKANLIRWQLTGWKPAIDTGDLDAYNAFLEKELKKLDAALPVCEEVGLMVVVDLHSGPGHWADGARNLFASAACQKRFVEVWEHIARRYKEAKAVWGYDLLNEPLENAAAEGVADWQGLAEQAARAIRKIDPDRTIIVEPAPWGGPDAIRNLQPLDVPNVVYSVHMYVPHAFTHQGVYDANQKPLRYPGEVDGKAWAKADLEAALAPVIEFQRTHGVHIFLGEFSAIRWAPDGSAFRYIRDCIEIFEKHGWDWTYHAFREWSGWSAEHGTDRGDTQPTREPSARKRLLLEWFAKNRKPEWYRAP